MSEAPRIAYFSMEIALDEGMPTYSGGLGVLAGDTLRSAADLGIPMVAVTLLHRKGYFYQQLDSTGSQSEAPVEWSVDDFVRETPARARVLIEGRTVQLRAWMYEIVGAGGFHLPVYLLDTDLPENSEFDRTLTDCLYGGDARYRLCQEVVLGIGGVRMLNALGYDRIERWHMNEGHASLLTLELLQQEARRAGRTGVTHADIDAVRERCIFTTHTPVPAGHDQFPMDLVRQVLGPGEAFLDVHDALTLDVAARVLQLPEHPNGMQDLMRSGNHLNLTYLALNLSHYVNGVAKRHSEVSRLMFAGYSIHAVTNGVHASTWLAPEFQELFDRHIPGWRLDNFSLRYALSIPAEEIRQARRSAKHRLLQHVNRATNAGMDMDVLTLGFGRRAAAYKRADLLFSDVERLRSLAARGGGLQIVYAGKAHPKDEAGKELIRRIFAMRSALRGDIRLAYLPNYDMECAKVLTAGVDVWLNTPRRPLEASGTSGMKAALNGVPSLSVLDGWWIEGHIEGVTGWSIGGRGPETSASDDARDAAALYDKLEGAVLPLYYGQPDRFLDIVRHAIALNGSFFNTHRMVEQYVLNAYFL